MHACGLCTNAERARRPDPWPDHTLSPTPPMMRARDQEPPTRNTTRNAPQLRELNAILIDVVA
eukprot:2870872-Prymnesium_polylepis.2